MKITIEVDYGSGMLAESTYVTVQVEEHESATFMARSCTMRRWLADEYFQLESVVKVAPSIANMLADEFIKGDK